MNLVLMIFYNNMHIYYHRLARVKDFDHLVDTIFKLCLDCIKDNVAEIITNLKEEIENIMTLI